MVTIVSDIAHIWTLKFKGNMYLYDNVNKSSINMSKLYMCFCYLGSGIWIWVLCLTIRLLAPLTWFDIQHIAAFIDWLFLHVWLLSAQI